MGRPPPLVKMAAAIARPTHAPDGVVTEVLVRPVVLPLVLLALLSGVAPPATAQWHQFRGPQAGVAELMQIGRAHV